MKKLNWGVVACGILGALVVIALPIAEFGATKVKLLSLGGQGYLTLGALLVGAAMGAFNLLVAPARWTGGVAIAAFLLAGMKLSGGDEGQIKAAAGASGGMMLAFVGALLAIAVTIKPGKNA